MFSLLRRANRLSANYFRPHLSLEPLQERVVPAAASLVDVNARIIGSTLIVTGQVSDDSAGADVVTLNLGSSGGQSQGMGMTSGNSSSVTTANDAFEFIIPNYTGTGAISLSIVDDETIATSDVSYTPTTGSNLAPYLTFSVQYNADQTVTFSGIVYDERPTTATVTITGLANAATLTPNTDGSYSLTVAYDETREISCQAEDDDDQLSNARDRLIDFQPPQFSNLDVGCIGHNTYQITGQVNGTFVAGMIITLDAPECPTLDGQVIIVQQDGSFSLTVLLSNDPLVDFGGTITLTVFDHWNNTEETGEVYLTR